MSSVSIPNRPAFRAQEVCEIAGVQPYVLKGWEAEFPDLGVSKGAGGARVYRRADVERVLQLKHLIAVEGLTLAGARRRLAEQALTTEVIAGEESEGLSVLDDEARAHLQEVKNGLQWILKTLDSGSADGFTLAADSPSAGKQGRAAKAAPAGKTAKAGKSKKK